MSKNIQKIIYDNKNLKDYSEKSVFEQNDTRISLMKYYLKNIININNDKKFRILDLGCADGEIYKEYTDICDFFGIDISESFLDKAKENGYKTYLLDIEKEKLPFDNNFFDIIIMGETIEHIVNTDFFMTEINRVLKLEGNLIISIPNINQWISFIMMLFFDLPPRYSARFRAPHVRDFTFKTMKLCLQEFGFSIKNRSGTGLFLPVINKNIFVKITKIFPRFATEIVFVCDKTKNVFYDEKKIVKF